MTNHQRSFQEDEAYAKRLANMLYRRSTSNPKSSMTWDDIYSDVCLTWVACRDNFNPDAGASFKTYFANAVVHNYGNAAKRRFRSIETSSLSIDTSGHEEDGDGGSLHEWEAIADHSADIESAVARRQKLRRLAGKYPLLVRCLELCADTPDDLQQELKAFQDYTQIASSMGFMVEAAPSALTVNMLHKVFGFNWRDRRVLHEEMERAAEYVG